jgi:hypothetical protein
MTKPLSPAAQAIWEAFNEDEAGVFVDYGDKLAAALRAAVDQVVPEPPMIVKGGRTYEEAWTATVHGDIRRQFLAIAAELEGGND